MPDKDAGSRISLLNTTISEMPVNDVPIDYLTKDKLPEPRTGNKELTAKKK